MAPTIPIDAVNLASLWNAGVIGAWMLSPDDEEHRRRFAYHVGGLQAVEGMRVGHIGADEAPGVVVMALEAFSHSDCQKHYEERAPRGCGAGMILYNASLRIGRSETAPITGATREVGEAVFGHSQTSRHVNDAVWRTFKPVAHLWAAYIHFDNGEPSGMKDFPCSAGNVPQFLAIAEAMRQIGECVRAPRRKETILKPGESVGLADHVLAALPAGSLSIIPRAS